MIRFLLLLFRWQWLVGECEHKGRMFWELIAVVSLGYGATCADSSDFTRSGAGTAGH